MARATCIAAILAATAQAQAADPDWDTCLEADASLMQLRSGHDSMGLRLVLLDGAARVVVEDGPQILGQRTLSLDNVDCRTRIAAVRFVVRTLRSRLVLRAEASLSADPSVDPGEPQTQTYVDEPGGNLTTPSTASAGSIPREMSTANDGDTDVARSSRVRMEGQQAEGQQAEGQQAEEAVDETRIFVAELGATLASGRAPSLAGGPTLALIVARGRASWRMGVTYLRGAGDLGTGSVVVDGAELSFHGCLSSRRAFSVGGCALIAGGLYGGRGRGFDIDRSARAGTLTLGLEFLLRYQWRRLHLFLAAGPNVAPVRAVFDAATPSARYEQNVIGFASRLGVGMTVW